MNTILRGRQPIDRSGSSSISNSSKNINSQQAEDVATHELR